MGGGSIASPRAAIVSMLWATLTEARSGERECFVDPIVRTPAGEPLGPDISRRNIASSKNPFWRDTPASNPLHVEWYVWAWPILGAGVSEVGKPG